MSGGNFKTQIISSLFLTAAVCFGTATKSYEKSNKTNADLLSKEVVDKFNKKHHQWVKDDYAKFDGSRSLYKPLNIQPELDSIKYNIPEGEQYLHVNKLLNEKMIELEKYQKMWETRMELSSFKEDRPRRYFANQVFAFNSAQRPPFVPTPEQIAEQNRKIPLFDKCVYQTNRIIDATSDFVSDNFKKYIWNPTLDEASNTIKNRLIQTTISDSIAVDSVKTVIKHLPK